MSEENFYKYSPGIGNVGSYQASGHPFLTGSELEPNEELRISFPYVTKSITVMQTGSLGTLRIHFDSTGSCATIGECHGSPRVVSNNHYWPLDSKEDSLTMNVKTKDIYISNPSTHLSGFQLFAELTRIHKDMMWTLTGSGLND